MAALTFQRNHKRRWLIALWLAGGVLAISFVASRPRGPAVPPKVIDRETFEAGPLQVGAAKRALPVAAGTALAGYGPMRGAARGVRDAPMARALVLGPLNLVSLDLVEVPAPLVEEIRRRSPGVSPLWVVATHTHSGPGGVDSNPLAQMLGSGRFRPEVFDSIAACAAETLAEARAHAEPATLWLATEIHPEAQELRRPGGEPDPTLAAIRAVGENGSTVATLVVYGDHPTLLPSQERLLSADWPGAAAAALERSGGIGMVLQGAGADVTPPRDPTATDPAARISAFGERVAALAEAALKSARPIPASRFESCTARVGLPPLDLEPVVPLGLHAPFDFLLGGWAPREADVALLRFDGVALSCIPGEVTGAAWKTLRPEPSGSTRSIPISLCGGDVSYIEAPGLWSRGLGERQLSFFGTRLAEVLGQGLGVCAARSP